MLLFIMVLLPIDNPLDNEWLTLETTGEDLQAAKQSPLKAPGPDGMHAMFIKSVEHDL